MTESWLPVVGFEGRYEVSSDGRVRSLRIVKGNCNKPRPQPLVLSLASRRGYPAANLSASNRSKMYSAHRLVAAAFLGDPPPGTVVCHLNGVRDDNRLVNLAYGTPTENEAHKAQHGTKLFGAAVPGARLAESHVHEILLAYRHGSQTAGCVALGRQFGVAPSVITAIVGGRAWKHVDRTPYLHLHTKPPKKPPAPRLTSEARCEACGAAFQARRDRAVKSCSPACLSDIRLSRLRAQRSMRVGPLFGSKE